MVYEIDARPALTAEEAAMLGGILADQGLGKIAELRALKGGRTNRVWGLDRRPGPNLVAKLSREADGTELFPNAPNLEWAAMTRLAALGLAPFPVAMRTAHGVGTILLSQRADPVSDLDSAEIARLLARIHETPGWPGLKVLKADPQAVMRQGDAMLQKSGTPGWLSRLRPRPPKSPIELAPRLIHRDLVPANMAKASGRLIALDWQCPALGDPAEDIAHASSPGMQSLTEGLPQVSADRLFAAYPDAQVRARFQQMAPLYRWRMACYCHLQASRGAPKYDKALRLECAALEQAEHQTPG